MENGLVAGIHPAGSGERLPGAGGDRLLARLATTGPCPITLVEDTSADREWAPLHRHPWDELTYVLKGEMAFTVGADTRSGGPNTLVSLPGVSPTPLRVPHGTARFLMLTVGRPH
jgi:Cupin domain